MRVVRRYSESFKLEVLRALEEGRYASPWEAGRAYGIRGGDTVACWVREYRKDDLLNKVVYVMKADEQSEVKKLRQEVRKLKDALADAHLDLKLERAYLQVACESAGIQDVEEFKKKHAGRQ